MSQRVNSNRLQGGPSFISSIVSSLYQLSGIALFVLIPATLWLGYLSLQSTYRFSEARYWIFHPAGKILVMLACVLYFYHSLVSFYYSSTYRYRIAGSQMNIDIIILILTAVFAGGLGYWLW